MRKSSQAARRPGAPDRALDQAVTRVRRRWRVRPRLGLILGSGFRGGLAGMEEAFSLPFSRLPGFPSAAVPGHEGRLVGGWLRGMPTLALSGRVHFYEGHDMETVTLGTRLLARLGVETLLVTNAAGGLNPRLRVGGFMILTDHINFMGVNPLRGPGAGDGSGFVDMTRAYDPGLQQLLRRAARKARIPLRSGVYLAVSGPSYETPAEIRAFRRLGADAVGMSTVPEVIAARQEGLRVAGLSCITNLAAGTGGSSLDHAEVLATGSRVSGKAARLLTEFAALYGHD